MDNIDRATLSKAIIDNEYWQELMRNLKDNCIANISSAPFNATDIMQEYNVRLKFINELELVLKYNSEELIKGVDKEDKEETKILSKGDRLKKEHKLLKEKGLI